MRSRAKTVNFGVLYGMGPMRLSRELSIPMAEARRFIDQYFAKMPAVKGYLEGSLEKARRDGFVSTVLGRRRYLPGLGSEDARDAQLGRTCGGEHADPGFGRRPDQARDDRPPRSARRRSVSRRD